MGHKFILPVAPPDQGTRRTMVLHTLLPCGSSLTYREMPEARCGRWCTLTDTIISRTNSRYRGRPYLTTFIGPANNLAEIGHCQLIHSITPAGCLDQDAS